LSDDNPRMEDHSGRKRLLGLLIDYHALVIEFRSSRAGSAEHKLLMRREEVLLTRIQALCGPDRRVARSVLPQQTDRLPAIRRTPQHR
jgi:hypothetical protein